MKKTLLYSNYIITIVVSLNYSAERKIDGKREHLVETTITGAEYTRSVHVDAKKGDKFLLLQIVDEETFAKEHIDKLLIPNDTEQALEAAGFEKI